MAVVYLATRVYAASKGWDVLPFQTLNVADGAISYHIERRGREFDIVEGLGFGSQASIHAEMQNLRRTVPQIEKRIQDCKQYLQHIEDTRKEYERLKTVKPISEQQIAAYEHALLDADKDESAWSGYLQAAKEEREAVDKRLAELGEQCNVSYNRWSFDLDNFVLPGVSE